MTDQIFSQLRKELDDAITFAEFDKAKVLADKGLNHAHLHESLGEIMYFKAQHAIIREDYKQAIRCLTSAIQYNPHDGAAYNDRAICIIDSGGSTDAAMADFDKGIEVEPDYATVYHNKGWLLNRLGRAKESIEFFNKSLELEPARAVTFENLADVYFNMGQYEKALAAYQRSIELLNDAYPEIKRQILEKIKGIIDTLRSP